ncbi:MAG TPA: hypothetical protein VGM88_31285 [Kofleriaceae bacterium]|jgi:hypothetical protein
MWRDADPDWLAIEPDHGGLRLTRGSAGNLWGVQASIPAEVWTVLAGRLDRAQRYVRSAGYPVLAGDALDNMLRAAEEHARALTAIYDAFSTSLGESLGDHCLVVLKPAELETVSLAAATAVARRTELGRIALPWDIQSVYAPADAASVACQVRDWLLPSPADIVLIAPTSLEPENAIGDSLFEARSEEMLATALLWAKAISDGIAAAQRAGAQVIRPATVMDAMRAFDGSFRACAQIVAHHDASGRLHFDDAFLLLDAFKRELQAYAASGWRSPLRAVDLTACNSVAFARCLHAVGIPYVTANHDGFHVAAAYEWMRRIYVHELLDGSTPLAHAWLRAALLPPMENA